MNGSGRSGFLDRALGVDAAKLIELLLGTGEASAHAAAGDRHLTVEAAARLLEMPRAAVAAAAETCKGRWSDLLGTDPPWTFWSPLDGGELHFSSSFAEALTHAPLLRPVSESAAVRFDADTERWIHDLVATAAPASHVHVLYRLQAAAARIDDVAREIEDLARRIAEISGKAGPGVFAVSEDVIGLPVGRSPHYAIIASCLTPGRAIKVFGTVLNDDNPPPPSEDDPFVAASATNDACHSEAIGSLARAMPHLEGVHVWCVPKGFRLSMPLACRIGAAFGPASLDPGFTMTRLRAMAPADATDGAVAALARLYDDPRPAAAIMAFASKTYDRLRECDPHADADEIVRRLGASVAPHVRGSSAPPPPSVRFDPELINSDLDLLALRDRHASMRAAGIRCLAHGIEGSGKGEFAWWFCRDVMKIPLKEVRASMLFERAWGGTERRIEAFMAEAAIKGAAVSISDCESLFGARRPDGGNNMALTIAATNAFLAALERFPGPAFASTNLIAEVDVAIRRRFDICVEFRPLTIRQEVLAWRRLLGLERPAWFDAGEDLVVADFAVTQRRLALFGESGRRAAARHLAAAAKARSRTLGDGSHRSRIGFLRTETTR